MSLFKTTDLGEIKELEVKKSETLPDDSREEFLIIKSRKEVEQITNDLASRRLIHYCTGGVFSAHELLFSVLEKTGPAKVYLTTWTMTEYPARLLSAQLASGRITELNCIMDIRMEKNPNVYQLIGNKATRIRLSHCHAKVVIVQNDVHSISIISSQNMTENPRIEAGVVSVNKDVADFHIKWILKEIENGHGLE